MKYTVLWTPAAEADLAALWLAATDRDAILRAVNLLDESLARDPESLGESRTRQRRIGFSLPLAIDFEVAPDDRLVYVLSVWQIRKGRGGS